jgi:rod shape-determining protein MreD
MVTVQTVIIPVFPILYEFYDILLVFVVFCSFSESTGTGLFFVLLSGFMMDSLSGGAFGVFFITYIWLYGCIRWMIQYFHAQNIFLIFLLLLFGIIFENIISSIIYLQHINLSGTITLTLNFIVKQIVWMILTGNIIYFIVENAFWFGTRAVEKYVDKLRRNQV